MTELEMLLKQFQQSQQEILSRMHLNSSKRYQPAPEDKIEEAQFEEVKS
jgi:hypothetical protein